MTSTNFPWFFQEAEKQANERWRKLLSFWSVKCGHCPYLLMPHITSAFVFFNNGWQLEDFYFLESSTELKDALRNVKWLNSILIYQTCWTEYIVHNLFVWSQKWASLRKTSEKRPWWWICAKSPISLLCTLISFTG